MMVMVAFALSAQAAAFRWASAMNATSAALGANVDVGTTIYLVLASEAGSIANQLDLGTLTTISTSTYGVVSSFTTTLANGSTGNVDANHSDIPLTVAGLDLVLFVISKDGKNFAYSGIATVAYTDATTASDGGLVTFTSPIWNAATASSGGVAGKGWLPIGIPEPATALLALAGVGLLIRRRRRA